MLGVGDLIFFYKENRLKKTFDSISTRIYDFLLCGLYELFPETTIFESFAEYDSLKLEISKSANTAFSGLRCFVGNVKEMRKSNVVLYSKFQYQVAKGYFFFIVIC